MIVNDVFKINKEKTYFYQQNLFLTKNADNFREARNALAKKNNK